MQWQGPTFLLYHRFYKNKSWWNSLTYSRIQSPVREWQPSWVIFWPFQISAEKYTQAKLPSKICRENSKDQHCSTVWLFRQLVRITSVYKYSFQLPNKPSDTVINTPFLRDYKHISYGWRIETFGAFKRSNSSFTKRQSRVYPYLQIMHINTQNWKWGALHYLQFQSDYKIRLQLNR